MMPNKIVIIGAGQAACSFAAKYRSHDADAEIVMVGDETMPPYQRPPLSKKYATGEMSADQLLLRPADWYQENNVRLLTEKTATAIDLDAKVVTLNDGQKLDWTKLFIATGSRPRTLPAAIGGELDGVYALRNLADAEKLRNELGSGKRVTIIGGGYIGLEAAAVAARQGLKVTLIEAADRILQRVACPQTSDYFRKLHTDEGVEILEAMSLERFGETAGRVSAVLLEGGRRIETDFVLVGIGILPNQELAEAAGLSTDNGILVDEHSRCSHADVYAAGDCTRFEFRGGQVRLESVQNAIDQAECAADNMAGVPRTYVPVPWFWSDQYDTKLQIAGLNLGYDQVIMRPGAREGALTHWYFAGGNFIAVDAMNDPRGYMVGKKLLEAGKNVTPEQISDPSLELKSLL